MQLNTHPTHSQTANPIAECNRMTFGISLQSLAVGYDNITSNPIAMSSLDIASLVGSRHDSVRLSIERLMDRGVIKAPPLVELRTPSGQASKAYSFTGDQGKRDSIVVVAQLSPELTAILIDRWRELEEEKRLSLSTMPNALTGAVSLASQLAHEVETLTQQVIENAHKVDFYHNMADTQQLFGVDPASKTLGTGPKRLFAYMRNHKILKSNRHRLNVPYQKHLDAGRFELKWGNYRNDMTGEIEYKAVPFFTGKGLTWIEQFIAKHGREGL